MLTELMSYLPEEYKSTSRDLFPGLDSSAFDEHKAYKKARPEVDKINRQITRLESLLMSALEQGRRLKKIFHSSSRHGRVQKPTDVELYELPWMTKYPYSRSYLAGSMVDTAAPNYDKLEGLIASYETTMEQGRRYERSIKRLKSKMLRVRKQEAERGIADRAAAIPKAKIDPNTMPRKFDIDYRTEGWATKKTDTFDNPYFLAGHSGTEFAGHPAHWDGWKGKLRTSFYEIEKWVKRLGHPEFDMMYASENFKDSPRYYITNKDNSVIIVNRTGRIYIHAKSPKLDASQPPIRWRMRRTRALDMDWLYDKLMRMVK